MSDLIPDTTEKPLPVSVLFDINTLHSSSTNNSIQQPIPSLKQSFRRQKIEFSNDGQIIIKNNIYDTNTPVFKFIMQHPNAQFIPRDLLNMYIGSFNISNQTPLMLAAAVSNVNFVRQLIPVDVGMLDDFGKSALDYAREFNSSADIIDLLSEYETA